jgi:hypothetical protein
MLERPQCGELALNLYFFNKYESEEIIKELQQLALAAGANARATTSVLIHYKMASLNALFVKKYAGKNRIPSLLILSKP